MEKKYFSGFTLVEVLVVVSIIAFLAVLIVAFFRGQLFKGNDAKRKGDINRIQIAAEEYEKDNNCYPLFITCNNDTDAQPVHPYLNNVPCDPVTKVSYSYEPDGNSGTCPTWYRIYSKLENDKDSNVKANIGPGGAYNYYKGSPNAPIPQNNQGNESEREFFACFNGKLLPVEQSQCVNTFPSKGFAGACVDMNGNPANECQAP